MKKNTTTLSDIIEKMHSKQSGKLEAKLPYWADIKGIQLPQAVSLQQASSQKCAERKVRLLKDCLEDFSSIIDLTGGFGADSWAFSSLFDKVHYFEQSAQLCDMARHNFHLLSAHAGRRCNIEVNNLTIDADAVEIMAGLKPDCVFIDPARRDRTGGKVFRLEDCTPNVVKLVPAIAGISPFLLMKLSPMISIQLVKDSLNDLVQGYKVLSIGLLGLGGEVKEMLVLMGSDEITPRKDIPSLFIDKCDAENGFMDVSEVPEALYTSSIDVKYLYEPDALLKKANAHALICTGSGIRKIGPDVHLYIGDSILDDALQVHFKTFRILEVLPFGKNAITNLGKKYPKAEVTSNALPLSSEELRSRLKVKDGPESVHIFAFSSPLGRYFIVGQRL